MNKVTEATVFMYKLGFFIVTYQTVQCISST